MKKPFVIALSLILAIVGFLAILIVKDCFVFNKLNDEIFIDKSHQNSNVVIRYPQIDDDNLEDINRLIKEFAENIASESYGEDYVNLNLEISNYEIVYHKKDLLSIVFEANGYVSTAAYSNRFLRTINIDLKTSSVISLSDIYFINDNFKDLVNMNFQEQFPPEKLKEWNINKENRLYDKYKKELSFVIPSNLQDTLLDENRFYFSENKLVICVGVEHAMGDYFELEIEYSKLKDLLKTDIKPFA